MDIGDKRGVRPNREQLRAMGYIRTYTPEEWEWLYSLSREDRGSMKNFDNRQGTRDYVYEHRTCFQSDKSLLDNCWPPRWEMLDAMDLTPEEWAVVELWLDKYTGEEISGILGVSQSTVQRRKLSIRDKATRAYHSNREVKVADQDDGTSDR